MVLRTLAIALILVASAAKNGLAQTPSTITSGTADMSGSACLKDTGTLSGDLYKWNGTSWSSITASDSAAVDPSQPTVVIAHGWNDGVFDASGTAATPWLVNMAGTLQLQDSAANILAWDWSESASSFVGQRENETEQLSELGSIGLGGAAASAERGSITGVILAHELETLHVPASGLQMIGHSNGGAVVGSAATELARTGQKVERLTTLDTPDLTLAENPLAVLVLSATSSLLPTGVNAMCYVNPSAALQTEVYFSGGTAGRTAFGFGAPLASSASNVFNGQMYPNPQVQLFDETTWDHIRATNWYSSSAGTPGANQFLAVKNWSILSPSASAWRPGDYAEQGYSTGVFGPATLPQPANFNLIKLQGDNFEDGTAWQGQDATIADLGAGNYAARVTAHSDGYLFQDVSVPADAYYLTFDLKIETPDAGDFLTVSMGNDLISYKPLDSATADFATSEPIYVGDYAGQTETLLFTLNHVGTGTPSILIDNVTFSAVPEPSSLVLMAVSVIGLTGCAWRRRNQRG